jgi:hypothetical protein
VAAASTEPPAQRAILPERIAIEPIAIRFCFLQTPHPIPMDGQGVGNAGQQFVHGPFCNRRASTNFWSNLFPGSRRSCNTFRGKIVLGIAHDLQKVAVQSTSEILPPSFRN